MKRYYRVSFYMNGEYEVLNEENYSIFKGSLTDCEAYISLKLNPDVEFI